MQKRESFLFNFSLLRKNFFSAGINGSHGWDAGDGRRSGFLFASSTSENVVTSDWCTSEPCRDSTRGELATGERQCEGDECGDFENTSTIFSTAIPVESGVGATEIGNNFKGVISKGGPKSAFLQPATAIGGEGGCTFATSFGEVRE